MPKQRQEDSGTAPYATAGKITSKIDVRISYRIIHLFSEGLYSSPNKAIEELVSNAFDAGAENVHVIVPPDLVPPDAAMVVVDDGEGMDPSGLQQHWIIGETNKRDTTYKVPKGRKQIGKFGIGKLAAYVLASHLTHVCKVRKKYFAATMDYSRIPRGQEGKGLYTDKSVKIPLRELTEAQAKEALMPFLEGTKEGYSALCLFGARASKSWTVAVMSGLKDMAREIRLGRLKWILSTAMPIRDDFKLYLNGDPVKSAKLKGKKIATWTIGRRSMKSLQKPAPDDLQATEDTSVGENAPDRFGLTHPQVGRVTGRVDLYEDLLTAGKSQEVGRSHGFFVYVCGRLINADDEYFGIDSNKLRHGTFSRFHCKVHIDRLDEELRSSRETVRETSLLTAARKILQGIFNVARQRHEKFETALAPGVQAARRVAASPWGLTRRPIKGLVILALEGKCSPRLTRYPTTLTKAKRESFLKHLEERAASSEGLVREVRLEEISQHDGIAIYDSQTAILQINSLHPFVAYFSNEFQDTRRNLPLELLAISEVLLEARLYELGLPQDSVDDVMTHRDDLLRYLARSVAGRNALIVAQDLRDAATDKNALERELVASFASMGFDTIPKGGKGNPDGLAEAILSPAAGGESRSYKVSLEAKSKEKPGTKVTAKSVGVSTIARQRDDERYKCDHAIVAGPDFPTTKAEKSALVKEIKTNIESTQRTITLVRIVDLARLVRLVPVKQIGLDKLRDMFSSCITPEETKDWIDKLAAEEPKKAPYRQILEAIAAEQKDVTDRAISYDLVEGRLRHTKDIKLARQELADICKALARMAPGFVSARGNTVEISTSPVKILDAISSTIGQYPEEDQVTLAKLGI